MEIEIDDILFMVSIDEQRLRRKCSDSRTDEEDPSEPDTSQDHTENIETHNQIFEGDRRDDVHYEDSENDRNLKEKIDNGMLLLKNLPCFLRLEYDLREEIPTVELPSLEEMISIPGRTIDHVHFVEPSLSFTIDNIKNINMEQQQISISKNDLWKLSMNLNEYLSGMLNLPKVVRSKSFATFLAVDSNDDMFKPPKRRERKRVQIRHDQKLLRLLQKDGVGRNILYETKTSVNLLPNVSPQNNMNMTTKNTAGAAIDEGKQITCFDFVFGNNTVVGCYAAHNEKNESRGNILVPRRGTYSRRIPLPIDNVLVWSFQVLQESSLPALPVYFSVSVSSDDGNTRIKEESPEGEWYEYGKVEEGKPENSFEDNNTVEYTRQQQKALSSAILVHEEKCSQNSIHSPYQGHFHNTTISPSGSVTITFQNTMSLFRSSHIEYKFHVIPFDAFATACTAADDANEAIRRRQRAPLLNAILSSNSVVSLRVEPLFFTVDDNKDENNDHQNDQLLLSSEVNSSVIFEDVLASSWLKKDDAIGSVQNTSSFMECSILLHDYERKNQFHCKVKQIVQPNLNRIKLLRRQLAQLAMQLNKTQNELAMTSKDLKGNLLMLKGLKKEQTQWNLDQRTMRSSLNELLRGSNAQKKLLKENEARIEILQNENDEMKRRLTEERNRNVFLEGKIREMERCRAIEKHSGQTLTGQLIGIQSSAKSQKANAAMQLPLPDFVIMPFKHPNPRINMQMQELRSRYVQLVRILNCNVNTDRNLDNDFKNNKELLRKIGIAIQDIMKDKNVRKNLDSHVPQQTIDDDVDSVL